MKRIDRLTEYVRSSLWVIPALSVVLAVVAGVALSGLDRSAGDPFAFGGGAVAARSILTTIAAAMITFTGLVFSITIVALQLAGGQYSPRVMRTFLRDRTSKLALATFVATFSFALTVLRATRGDAIPGISVNVAIILVFVSVGVFIHYINHTAHAIRAAAIIESVAAETRDCIERVYPQDRREIAPATEEPGDGATLANDGRPGVVTDLDVEGIVACAVAAGGLVTLRVGVGDFVPTGGALLDVRAPDPSRVDPRPFVRLARERTMQMDPAFGIRQLVDLATRALSPGINDPTTAVQALDQIHDILRRLVTRPLPPGRAADADGVLRLSYATPTWADFVSLGTDEIRICGAASLQVHRRLRSMLEDLLQLADAQRRPPLTEQLTLLDAAAQREFADARDRRMAGLADAQGIGS